MPAESQSPALVTGPRERMRVLVGWWTTATWAIYVASFLPSFAFLVSDQATAWLVIGIAGFIGGVMALRDLRGWRLLLLVAYAVLIVWLVVYWVGLVDKILANEETKTLSQALFRVWRMFELALSPSARHGNMLGVIATLYREILMPALQVLAVIALFTWAAIGRIMPPNSTVETDAKLPPN